jgi:hypothetical protein
MVTIFIFKLYHPITREIDYFNFDSRPFSIYFCIAVEKMKVNDDFGFGLFDDNFDDYSHDDVEAEEEMTFKGKFIRTYKNYLIGNIYSSRF